MTRIEIENLKVGDMLSGTMDIVGFTGLTQLKPGARWSKPEAVIEICSRGISVKGNAYAVVTTTHGANGSTLTFSFSEGENHWRIENT